MRPTMLVGPFHILFVCSEGCDRVLREVLEQSALSFELRCAEGPGAAIETIRHSASDIVIVDMPLPDGCGVETVARLCEHAPRLPIIALIRRRDEALGIETIRAGAQECLVSSELTGESLARSIRFSVERKCADLEARARARAEARTAVEAENRARSESLATLSHELRTPLNGVIGMTELLLGTDLDERQRRYAWLAKTSGDALLSLINDVLDFSKIEAGRLELEGVDFDLRYLVETIASSFASLANGKGLELMAGIHPEVPSLLRGDSGRLQQILRNLVGNAVKFTERGEVVVRATKDEETPHHVIVRFTVSDTGIGIPADRMDRLFHSFSQVDASTTRRFGGTGLGLAICKRLAILMGGQVGVESEPGRGSTFWFTARLEKCGDPGAPRALRGDLPDLRILVVDDNETNRQIFSEQLQAYGLSHDLACNARAALARLREEAAAGRPYGVAILDMQMPDMDGVRLAEAIKGDRDVHDTVLLLVSSGPKQDAATLRKAGFSGWMMKPVRQSQLMDAIADAVACASAGPPDSRQEIERVADRARRRGLRGPAAGARILLTEDHEISQEVAATMLREAGLVCDIARNGREAVEAVRRCSYDLVLMDCQMPEMDGFEATREIRSLERRLALPGGDTRRRLPIVALTANALKEDRDRCLEAGMDDYLSKPLDPQRLLAAIESLIVTAEGHPANA